MDRQTMMNTATAARGGEYLDQMLTIEEAALRMHLSAAFF